MASARASSPQTWNRYSYALNSPLRLIDPTGMDPDETDQSGQPPPPPPPPRVVVVMLYGGSVSGGTRVSGGTDNSTGTHRVRPRGAAPGLGENVLDTEANNIAQQIANCFPDAEVVLGGPTAINQVSTDLPGSRPDHVLIYGFSMGANTAVALTNLLTKNGLKVDQLTTVDPAGMTVESGTDIVTGILSPSRGVVLPGTENAGSFVLSNLNIARPEMVGDPLNYVDTLGTTVGRARNEAVTGDMRQSGSTPLVHTTIDDITSPRVVQRMSGKLMEIYNKPR